MGSFSLEMVLKNVLEILEKFLKAIYITRYVIRDVFF